MTPAPAMLLRHVKLLQRHALVSTEQMIAAWGRVLARAYAYMRTHIDRCPLNSPRKIPCVLACICKVRQILV